MQLQVSMGQMKSPNPLRTRGPIRPRAFRLAVPLLLLVACGAPQVNHHAPRRLPADPFGAAVQTRARALAAAESAVDPSAFTCEEVEPDLIACPSAAHLEDWAWELHLMEPEERYLAAPLDPPDPVVIREGLDVYDALLHTVARRSRSQMDLWEHTPTLSSHDIYYFQANPEVWRATVSFRSTQTGRPRRERLRELAGQYEGDYLALRHLTLRDGYFYFEDPLTADWAADNIKLRDLFVEPRIVLDRAGARYYLERGRGGHYYYQDDFERYRARLTLFDRVGLEKELAPAASYRLVDLRRRLGLDHLEVGPETGAGRNGEAVFLAGDRIPARLVRTERGVAQLGLLASVDDIRTILARSRIHGIVVYGIIDTAFTMVRENLFFDEPANEVGQQDGIMRLAFMDAFRNGATEYTVNEVAYSIYDESGRPRPPQVCIDFITDAVERFSGSWWPEETAQSNARTEGRINMRDYMSYRQVRRLVELADTFPFIAQLFSFKREDRVPFGEREGFFQNLWKHRDDLRIADIIVIYGLRSDGRNHYHSFYIYDTDPVYGMPITLTDQAGHARIRSWTSVMSTAPRRSVQHRIRWNPFWVLNPEAVELGFSIQRQAAQVARGDDLVEASGEGP